MVGGIGIEPTTTWMSTKRSTTELSAYKVTMKEHSKSRSFYCQTFCRVLTAFFLAD